MRPNFLAAAIPGSGIEIYPRPRPTHDRAEFSHSQCANRPFWPLVSKYTIFENFSFMQDGAANKTRMLFVK